MMDAKMKGMVMAGMMALSLVLGAMVVFSDTWLTSEDTEDDETYRSRAIGNTKRIPRTNKPWIKDKTK